MKTIFKYNLKDYLPIKAIPARTVAGGHKTNAGELTLAGTGDLYFVPALWQGANSENNENTSDGSAGYTFGYPF